MLLYRGGKDGSKKPMLRLLELSMQGVTVAWSKVITVKVGTKWVDLENIVEVELTELPNGLKGRL